MSLTTHRQNIKYITGNSKLADAKLDWAINRAYEWVKNKVSQLYDGNMWVKTTTITTTAGTDTYDLPADFVSLRAIIDENGDNLLRLDLTRDGDLYNNANMAFSAKAQRKYAVLGFNTTTSRSTVIFKPNPTGTNTYTAYYNYNPPALSVTTDEPQLPTNFHEVIDLYGAGMIYEAQQDTPAAASVINRAKDLVDTMVGHLNKRDVTSNPKVVQNDNYMSNIF